MFLLVKNIKQEFALKEKLKIIENFEQNLKQIPITI